MPTRSDRSARRSGDGLQVLDECAVLRPSEDRTLWRPSGLGDLAQCVVDHKSLPVKRLLYRPRCMRQLILVRPRGGDDP